MNYKKATTNRQSVDRRDFVRMGGAALAGIASTTLVDAGLFDARFVHGAPSSTNSAASTNSAESAVVELYTSLTDKQKQAVCRPFEHETRRHISPNWHITDTTIGDGLFTKQQQAIIDQILRNITSEDGYQRLLRQMDDDDDGIDNYSIAIFGEPGTSKFQWEMTGRHLTMRADGNRVDQAAFGGPIVYGHSEEDPKQNLFHYQTKMANEVFQALDPKQAQLALLKQAPEEDAVQLQGPRGKFPGIAVDTLAEDQKQLLESTLKVLLAPYRQEDVSEVMSILKSSGGLDQLHMAFYQEDDLDSDKVWDIWRVEGPSLVWHFRGAPHVHAYINIGVTT
ncbi:MAG: DUF3500 domain-containing protein [Pirellulales bacterium]